MKLFCFIWILVVVFAVQAAETNPLVKKLNKETEKEFVERVTKGHVLEGQIVRTKKLDPTRDILVAFTTLPFDDTANSDLVDIYANVFVPTSINDEYRQLSFLGCEVEGGSATLRSFFFTAVEGENTSLGFICGWDAAHVAAECAMGDQVKFLNLPSGFAQGALQEVKSKKIEGLYKKVPSTVTKGFDCTVPRFKNAADVKRLLAK